MSKVYDQYWKYTAAWTDINGNAFIQSLTTCVHYFRDHSVKPYYDSSEYDSLQNAVVDIIGFDKESARKAINQFVKLGFLKPRMRGFYPEAYAFVKAKSNAERRTILSKAVYQNANFQHSMTKPHDEWNGQMGFLVKTLEECKSLSKNDLMALMTYDYPSREDKDYLNKKELNDLYEKAVSNGFTLRKKNQHNHFRSLLDNLDDLRYHKGTIYFEEDAQSLFGDEDEKRALSKYRDPYLQRAYKRELLSESNNHCMVENVEYPVLIASHIRPYSDCRDKNDSEAAFDPNNGLLLSKNLDSLFDLGYISFNDDGSMIISESLKPSVVNRIGMMKILPQFINKERLEYMKYHREYVFNKRFQSASSK